jgi:flagellar protein FliO/FliZ
MKSWLVFLLLWVQPLMANELDAQIPQVDPVSSSMLGKITLGLGFILLLIFILAWFMKKMQLTPQSNNQLINIISAVSVGQRDRIALIQVGEEQILVGLTPGRIEKLHAMKNRVELPAHNVVGQNRFYDKFSQLMKQGQSGNKNDR